MKPFTKTDTIFLSAVVILIVLSSLSFFRVDLTSDKRFSISAQSKELMKSVKTPMSVTLYLTGDLNPGFLRLKNSAVEIIEELNAYSAARMVVGYKNPAEADNMLQREKNFEAMEKRGMSATSVYDSDKEGKAVQKIIYPWAEISYQGKRIAVNLLKNNRNLTGEENLNISIENLEFELTDAVRRLVNTSVEKIAFLEGHGELTETETYDISKSLSRYFQVDRGVITNDARVLENYKAIIIAKPTEPLSEKDKYVIDQYIMSGGTALWLVDGVKISEGNLAKSGETPAIANDLNLNDILFRYGVRINPVVVEDVQCVMMPLNVAPQGQTPQYKPFPWIYAPLLLTSAHHPVTKNLSPVKAQFASILDAVGDDELVRKTVVLASSAQTHLLQTPAKISLAALPDLKDDAYFRLANVPVGVVLEGNFTSNFANRMAPPEITNPLPVRKLSAPTRQIVIADGDIIRNEVVHNGDSLQALPLGFDRYSNRQFGNNEFITNSVLYLTDKNGWMQLRSRTLPMRLLNKNLTSSGRTLRQLFNVALPLLLLTFFCVVYLWRRGKRYV